jgi:hypothetical protein
MPSCCPAPRLAPAAKRRPTGPAAIAALKPDDERSDSSGSPVSGRRPAVLCSSAPRTWRGLCPRRAAALNRRAACASPRTASPRSAVTPCGVERPAAGPRPPRGGLRAELRRQRVGRYPGLIAFRPMADLSDKLSPRDFQRALRTQR